MNSHKFLLVMAMVVAITLAAFGADRVTDRTAEAACPPGTPAGVQCATTSGTVTTSGVTPVIECKWELADMDLAAAGFQYVKAAAYDDDMTVTPDGNPATGGIQVPCDLAGGASPTGPATMPNDVHRMIQVAAPNHSQNDPLAYRDIQLWVAAEPVSAITGVFWEVYEQVPPGSVWAPTCSVSPCWALKVQVHSNSGNLPQNDFGAATAATAHGGTAISPNGLVTGTACDGLGASAGSSTLQANSMFGAAFGTGQMTNQAITEAPNNWGIVSRCLQGAKGLYSATFQLDKDEACGEYKIVVNVVASGTGVQRTNYLDVLCNVFAETDFTNIDWGSFNVSQAKVVVTGNLAWNNPAGTNNMTIANGNNDGMGVKVKFDAMTGTSPNLKTITQFDACFGRSASDAQVNCEDPILAGNLADLSDETAVNNATPPQNSSGDPATTPRNLILCANEIGKLDVSLHPTGDLIADTYTGNIYVYGYRVSGFCYGDIHPASGPGPVTNEPVTGGGQ